MLEPSWSDLYAQLAARERQACEGGGAARQARQVRLGRMTARARIDCLLDAGSFVELGRHILHRHSASSEQLAANRHPGDGVIAGVGRVAGKNVAVYAHDPTVLRGALGLEASKKVCRLLDIAGQQRIPVICLADSDGVRIDEGTDAIDAYGEIIRRTVRLKGNVLQLTLACGLCVGAAAYTAALGDLVAMVSGQSYLLITGPKVTKVVTGEDVSLEDLGGSEMHATKTGQCHAIVSGEAAGIEWLRAVLAFTDGKPVDASACGQPSPHVETIVPTAPRRAYDVKKLIAALSDEGSMVELSPKFARNLVTAFVRFGGGPVAVVASQPLVLAGCLDVDASRKGAHFVRLASDLGIPVLTLVDVPGFLPGRKQEEAGILPHGSGLLSAYGSARVPLVCLIVRKSYGGASVLSFAAAIRLALPTARVGPMGADAALEVAIGPVHAAMSEEEVSDRAHRRSAWLEAHDHAWAAAASGYVDQVIHPGDARSAVASSLAALASDRGR